MKKIFVLLAFFAALVLAGCPTDDNADNTDVIGTWRGTGMSLEIGDGTFSFVYGAINDAGTWTRDANQLTLTSTTTGSYLGTATLSSGSSLTLIFSNSSMYGAAIRGLTFTFTNIPAAPVTSLKIQNETFTDLIDITWNGVTFVSAAASLERGKSITKPVQAGQGYIYFRGKSNSLLARTQELVAVPGGEQKDFVFLDTTLIVEKDDSSNTGQLKDLISKLSKPSTPVLSAVSGSITATWAAVAGAARYQVYCGIGSTPPAIPSKDVTGTTATIVGLTNEQQYFVWVKAINTLGESPLSDPADIIVRAPALPKPSTPVLSAASGSITAIWAEVAGAARYQVYCGIGSTPPATPNRDVTGTTATITGLTNEQQYFVWVKAINGDSESPLSDPADIIVRPPTPPMLTWNGPWTRNSDTSYTSNSITVGSTTWETLTIITPTECSIMVSLTASCYGDNRGYAIQLDRAQSTSYAQLSVTGTTSQSYTYTVPAGTHTIHFGYKKNSSYFFGNDNVTVAVTVQ